MSSLFSANGQHIARQSEYDQEKPAIGTLAIVRLDSPTSIRHDSTTNKIVA